MYVCPLNRDIYIYIYIYYYRPFFLWLPLVEVVVSSPNLRKVLGILTDTADTDRRLLWWTENVLRDALFFPLGNEPKMSYETQMSSTLIP